MQTINIIGDEAALLATSDDQAKRLDDFLAGVERRAYRMAEIATGNSDEALDLVQDSMLKLVNRYASRSSDELQPLFFRILQNGIRDWHRRQSTRRGIFAWLSSPRDDDDASDPIQEAADPAPVIPERLAGSDELADAIDQGLRALPQRQQQTFMLRVWEGLDVAETAFALGISEGSVKTHLARANASLRQSLAGFRDEPPG